jgi:hypothetical protein
VVLALTHDVAAGSVLAGGFVGSACNASAAGPGPAGCVAARGAPASMTCTDSCAAVWRLGWTSAETAATTNGAGGVLHYSCAAGAAAGMPTFVQAVDWDPATGDVYVAGRFAGPVGDARTAVGGVLDPAGGTGTLQLWGRTGASPAAAQGKCGAFGAALERVALVDVTGAGPRSGPTRGGWLVTVSGRGFRQYPARHLAVWVGPGPCAAPAPLSDAALVCVAPPGVGASLDVRAAVVPPHAPLRPPSSPATAAALVSGAMASGAVGYDAAAVDCPTAPAVVAAAGGTRVTVTGHNLGSPAAAAAAAAAAAVDGADGDVGWTVSVGATACGWAPCGGGGERGDSDARGRREHGPALP